MIRFDVQIQGENCGKMAVLHCKNCDTPCDPLSHFCSWCGTPLAQIKVPHNQDQQGHVDFGSAIDSVDSTQVGQVRIYISDDFIQNSKTDADYSTFYCEIVEHRRNLVVFVFRRWTQSSTQIGLWGCH